MHGWLRACKELKEARRGESLTESACWVQGQMANKWLAFGVSFGCGPDSWACDLHNHPVPHGQKGSVPGFVLCSHYRDIVNTFWTRNFVFSSCIGFHKLCSLVLVGYEIRLCHLLGRRPWGNPLAFLRLSFCFMESIISKYTVTWIKWDGEVTGA